MCGERNKWGSEYMEGAKGQEAKITIGDEGWGDEGWVKDNQNIYP